MIIRSLVLSKPEHWKRYAADGTHGGLTPFFGDSLVHTGVPPLPLALQERTREY